MHNIKNGRLPNLASAGESTPPACGCPMIPPSIASAVPAAKKLWVEPALTIETMEEAANGSGGVGADDTLFAS